MLLVLANKMHTLIFQVILVLSYGLLFEVETDNGGYDNLCATL